MNQSVDYFESTAGHSYFSGNKPKKLAFSSSDDAVRQKRVYAWRDHLCAILAANIRKNDADNRFRDQIASMPLTWGDQNDKMPSLASRLSIPAGLEEFEGWRAAGRYDGLPELVNCVVNGNNDNFVLANGQTPEQSLAIFQEHFFPGTRLPLAQYFENVNGVTIADEALRVVRSIMSDICLNVEDTTQSDVRNGFVKNLNFYVDTLVADHCQEAHKNDFLRVVKFVKFVGRGELAHIKTNTLYDIIKRMLKRVMSDNAAGGRFPNGTPMGGSRFRTQFTTQPDRFDPFAETMTLLFCCVGATQNNWESIIKTIAAKRRIEFREVNNRDIILEKRLFLDEVEKLCKASTHAELSQVEITIDLSTNNFRDTLAAISNQQRLAVLKNMKRESNNFNQITEEIEGSQETQANENDSDEINAFNAKVGNAKVRSWQNSNQEQHKRGFNKYVNLSDIKFKRDTRIDFETGRVLEFTQTKLNASDLKEAIKSCPHLVVKGRTRERRQDVRRKVTNFIAKKGTRRSPRHNNNYVLASEVTCQELLALQDKLEVSSEEELDFQSFAIEDAAKAEDGYGAFGISEAN